MSDYVFQYRLYFAPAGTTDGAGRVNLDIDAVHRLAGSSDPWVAVPGHHQTVSIPAVELKVVNDMPDGTPAQKTAKNAAYKVLVATYLGIFGYILPGIVWDSAGLEAFVDANDSATLEASRMHAYLTVTLGQSYPIQFAL